MAQGSLSRRVTLEPCGPTDLVRLAAWLRAPHVAPWYPDPEADLARAAAPPAGSGQAFIAVDGEAVGYLRWQHVDRATLDAMGLQEVPANSVDADILLGVEAGRGIGPAALALLADDLRAAGDVPMLGLTSHPDNERAHRAFAKAGFRFARLYAPDGARPMCLFLLRLHD
ncbi:MAG TPA: GNAT family N-acetyltransferase [Pseudomonadales bacterium]|nr:GNAT family N-acetyltransferase [Pseudomonadales bacterium]